MDLEQELESIRTDARIMQAVLEVMPREDGNLRMGAAWDAGNRIVNCCERVSKRLKCMNPPVTAVVASMDDVTCGEANDVCEKTDDPSEKASLLEQSRCAGKYLIPFGKHKGVRVESVPKSYLCWLLGVKRNGRDFESISMDKHGWIVANHADAIAQVKRYLTWRCWACGSTATRFKFSKLCSDCWHDC